MGNAQTIKQVAEGDGVHERTRIRQTDLRECSLGDDVPGTQ